MVSRPRANTRRFSSERGSAVIEFMFTSLIWLPLLLGTIVFSVNLVQAIQVSQLARDSGHMFAYGIDFSQSQNVAVLARLAAPVGIVQNGGKGAVLLSKVTLVTQADCDAAAMKTCPNRNKYVFTTLFVFGNMQYAKSQLGSPSASYLANGMNIQASQYMSDAGLVAGNFANVLQFAADQPGQYAFVSEVTINSQAISWNEFSNTGSYARSIF